MIGPDAHITNVLEVLDRTRTEATFSTELVLDMDATVMGVPAKPT